MILITYPIILIGIPTHLKHFRNHMRLQTKTWAAKLEFFIQDWKNGFSQKAPILWFWVKAYLNIYIKWSQKPLTECQHLFFPQNFLLEHCVLKNQKIIEMQLYFKTHLEFSVKANLILCLKVRDMVEECQCPTQFPMIRVSEGKYRIGETRVLIFVRVS